MNSFVMTKRNPELVRNFTLSLFLAGIFMGALDHGIVGPAFSSINQHFGISASWGVWSFTIYTLFFSASIPLMGKMSDRFGRKKIFMLGITLFSIGSIIAAIAPSFSVFLLGRVVQAIGTGGIFPITAAFIAVNYPDETRAKVLGLIGVVFGLGTILGPIVGGVIIGSFSWKWIFLINVPITAMVLAFMAPISMEQPIQKKPIDVKGSVLLVTIIFMIMLGITMKNGWLLAAGIIIIPFFAKLERRTADPILNIDYFKKRSTLVVLILSLLSGFIMASSMNLLPSFIEVQFSLDKSDAALSVTPLAVASMVASLVGGFLVTKIGAKKSIAVGFLLTLVSSVALVYADSFPLFLAAITIIGFGIGIIIGSPLNVLMIQNVNPAETGSAIGYLSLARSMGSTLGPTIAGIFIALSATSGYVYTNYMIAVLSLISVFVIISKKS
jgi:EmrB/QacA subfamily drug resistance transporter